MANVLDATTIQALLASQKSRGEYDAEVSEFINSGEAGIEVSLTEGRFAGSTAAKVRTGLNNARNRTDKTTGKLVHAGGNLLTVISVSAEDAADDKEHIYLINKGVGGEADTEADES